MPGIKRNGRTYAGTPTKVDTAKSYTTFTSKDAANPDSWEDVELLASKEEQQSLFSKISTMFKNIRYLYKVLGTADISEISDGTVKGAIRELADNPADASVWISQAEYDALSDEEKDSDTQYYIYDANSNDNAYTVPFASEQYEAENVGDALNEVNSNLESRAKIINFDVPPSGSAKIKFTNISSALISVTTNSGSGYGCYFVQGYGHTTARMHVAVIQAGSAVSYSVSETEAAVIINNTTTNSALQGAIISLTGSASISY